MEQVSINSEKEKKAMQSSLPSLNHAVATDVGLKRSQNQDSFGFAETAEAKLYIVADGMGGSSSGEVASQLAAQISARACFDNDGTISQTSIARGIQASNRAIHFLGTHTEKYREMGSTIVSVAFTKDQVIYAHVGDSRIYYYHQRGLIRLTKDHTLIQQLLDENQITEEQAESHPFNHVLLHSVGGNEETEITVGTLKNDLEVGDKFLLCCDGLTNHVSDQEIADIMASLGADDAVQCLLSLANHRGGSDNITVEIVEVRDSEGHHSNTPDLSAGQFTAVFSRALEDEFKDIIAPYCEHLSEIPAGNLTSEVLVPVDTPTPKLFESASLGFILEETKEETSKADSQSEKQEPSVEANPSSEPEQDREGIAFDTMIFEGDSIDDILELRELYFQAKSMGKNKLSEVLAEAAGSESGGARSGRGMFFNAAMFLSGGLAVFFLGQKVPEWTATDTPETVIASNGSEQLALNKNFEVSPANTRGSTSSLQDITVPAKTIERPSVEAGSASSAVPVDKVKLELDNRAEQTLNNVQKGIKEPLPEKFDTASFKNEVKETETKQQLAAAKARQAEVEKREAAAKAEREAAAKAEKEAIAKAKREAIAKAEKEAIAKAEREAAAKAKKKAADTAALAKAEKEAAARTERESVERRAARSKLDQELASIETSIRTLKQDISSAKRTAAKTVKKSSSSSSEVRAIETKIAKNRRELNKWKSFLANSSNGDIESMAREVAPVSSQVKTTLAELNQKNSELATLNRQIKKGGNFALKKKKKVLEARVALTKKQLRQRVNIGASNRVSSLEKDSGRLQSQLTAAKKNAKPGKPKQSAASKAKINKLNAELKQLENKRTNVKKQIKSIR